MTVHLTLEQMQRWHAEGAGDRDTIVSHLAACDACGLRYAELVRTAAPDTRAAFDVETFRAAGHRVGHWRLGRRATAWRVSAAAAAAAAVLVAAVYVSYPQFGPAPVYRGDQSGVRLVQPSGIVDRADLVFVWEGPEGAYRLRVVDLDAPDAPVIARDDVSSGYRPSAGELAALRAGVEYRWFVERPEGDALTSPAARFSVR